PRRLVRESGLTVRQGLGLATQHATEAGRRRTTCLVARAGPESAVQDAAAAVADHAAAPRLGVLGAGVRLTAGGLLALPEHALFASARAGPAGEHVAAAVAHLTAGYSQ